MEFHVSQKDHDRAQLFARRRSAVLHQKCGQTTFVTEDDFVGLCNPFEFCLGTYCGACERPDGLSQFAWADTQERVSEYRERLRNEAPAFLRVWNSLLSPLLGVMVGGAAALLPKATNPILVGMIGAVVGGVVMRLAVGPRVCALLGAREYYQKP